MFIHFWSIYEYSNQTWLTEKLYFLSFTIKYGLGWQDFRFVEFVTMICEYSHNEIW